MKKHFLLFRNEIFIYFFSFYLFFIGSFGNRRHRAQKSLAQEVEKKILLNFLQKLIIFFEQFPQLIYMIDFIQQQQNGAFL